MSTISIFINAPGQALDQEIIPLEIPQDALTDGKLSIGALKGVLASNAGIPASQQQFYLNGQHLKEEGHQVDLAALSGQMLYLLVKTPGQASQSQARPANRTGGASRARNQDASSQEIETVRLRLLGDPGMFAGLRDQSPRLAEAINDPERFRQIFMELKRDESERERERQHQIALLNEDPFNVDAQRRIEEMIRQDRVMENLQHAYENNPEVFGRVTMLYVNAEVNGHPIKAFVDSGAQVTIMSPSCAEKCGIMRLIDTRFSGMARGVGTAKILGRVHHAEIKIGGAVMPCAFTVMEGKDVDLLFGLDMLKRYRASIDLEKNALCFQGIQVPFLGEAEIPKQFEEAALDEPTIPGPNGTEIGGRSGAVRPAGTAAGGVSQTSRPDPTNTQRNSRGQGQTLGQGQFQQVTAPPQPTEQPDSFPEETIKQLIDLGFSREHAIEALRATGGNAEYAAGLLFSQ